MTLLALVVAGMGAAQAGAPACQAEGAITSRVRAVAEGIIAADNARDIDRVRSLYAPDAVLMPPNEPPLQGWAAIRPRYESLFAGFGPALRGHLDEVCVSGAVAFVRGSNAGNMVGRGGAATRPVNDVYVMLLRLDPVGGWRISHLIWHSPAPAAPRD